jgi:hypothetical protein
LSFTANTGRHSRHSSSSTTYKGPRAHATWPRTNTWPPGARSNQDKGKGVADDQVRAPLALRPFRTPTTFYRPSDPVRICVLYQQHFENIAREEPCAWDCTMPDCVNRVHNALHAPVADVSTSVERLLN